MKDCIQHRTLAAHPRAGQLLATFMLATLLAAAPAHADLQYQRLKLFGNASQTGLTPAARLLEGNDGALYGTTAYTVSDFDFRGVVFRVNQDGSGYIVLHHFGGTGDGKGLYAGLVEGNDGALYGTTFNGGSNGAGTVFKLDKDGSGYAILHSFSSNGVDGRSPGELTMGSDGILYGTTRNGGSDDGGTVFKLNKDGGGYQVLHSFKPAQLDGEHPFAGLTEGSDGTLFGTAKYGGTNAGGTVFKLNKDGSSYSTLRHFGSGSDGSRPQGALLGGTDGVLYGTTFGGGSNAMGTVFKLNGDGSGYGILHHFVGDDDDGRDPAAPFVEGADGSLYGTTANGGIGFAGTVFKLNKDGTGYGILHHFTGSPGDGELTGAALIQGSDGMLYGTTQRGGANIDPLSGAGVGTLFKLNPDGSSYAVFHHFQADFSGEGVSPNRLLDGTDGKLYGTTQQGGTNSGGTVFRMNRDGSGFTSLHHFAPFSNPKGGLVEGTDGVLYGTTQNAGTIYKLNKDGGGFDLLHRFTGTFLGASNDGAWPVGELMEASDGMLYGTTSRGGSYTNVDGVSGGTVFKLNKDGTGYGILRHFGSSASEGLFPQAGLVEVSDGVLFGTTYAGGSNGWGTLFKINKDGSSYSTLRHFGSGSDGKNPNGALLEASDGMLYGTTEMGGNAGWGTVFRMNKNGTGYAILRSFVRTQDNGYSPVGRLMEGSDGLLYGTAQYGGPHTNAFGDTMGTLFRINKDGSEYQVLHDFGGTAGDGQNPRTGVIQSRDGGLYGATELGGELGFGTLFKLSWPVVITRYERNESTAQLGWSGVPNWPYRIQARTNLVVSADSWVDLGTNTTTLDGNFELNVLEPPNTPARFYRIVWP